MNSAAGECGEKLFGRQKRIRNRPYGFFRVPPSSGDGPDPDNPFLIKNKELHGQRCIVSDKYGNLQRIHLFIVTLFQNVDKKSF
jgi:hypothetical protein